MPWGRHRLRPSEQTSATRKPDRIWELDPIHRTGQSQQGETETKLPNYCRSVTSAISGKPWPPARLGIYPAGESLGYYSSEGGRAGLYIARLAEDPLVHMELAPLVNRTATV
jgi:hypothetical protein